MSKSVLAVMAHPDDAELRCFGTLCKYNNLGYRCKILIICAGENGFSIQEDQEEKISLVQKEKRKEETLKAFEETNIEISVLNFNDGEIQFSKELITSIEKVMREFSPSVVITHYPDIFGVDHQDHSTVGKATINCASRLEEIERIMLCEPLLTVRSGFSPNHFVNITEFFYKKMAALSYHETQQGRYYLEEKYHDVKSSFYSLSIGGKTSRNNKKFEAFQLLYSLED
ncbi:PIG-L deacetylase family protein [Halalkalibacter sp. APA_J-10(15)]|uniref:PIG-L deacetylase family protein n=1 Tax=Halalkalibacter sp. APA_J-10(15) TaxID=2933805 RepID=UPI001FF6C03C|nr:PIG-L family deacetylase [Halalkalibacter sp. APA_J-10(15)]MCK0473041.1 PIG-L family deacetylase [Halalkalibacter sp. APA_J-10(15)]